MGVGPVAVLAAGKVYSLAVVPQYKAIGPIVTGLLKLWKRIVTSMPVSKPEYLLNAMACTFSVPSKVHPSCVVANARETGLLVVQSRMWFQRVL